MMAILPWIVGFLLIAIVLKFGVEWVMRRLNVHPADPELRSRGFGDVVIRLRTWADRKRRERDIGD